MISFLPYSVGQRKSQVSPDPGWEVLQRIAWPYIFYVATVHSLAINTDILLQVVKGLTFPPASGKFLLKSVFAHSFGMTTV
jgi:hypothetical protein